MTPAGMFAMAYGQARLRRWPALVEFPSLLRYGGWHDQWHIYLRGLTVPSGAEWRR